MMQQVERRVVGLIWVIAAIAVLAICVAGLAGDASSADWTGTVTQVTVSPMGGNSS